MRSSARKLTARTFGLAELLHPLSPRVFMAEYWQKKPYVRHGSLQRFRQIAEIPALRSIEAILEVWRGTAEAWAPRGTGNPLMKAEAHQLSDFFESGYTLYLSHVEEHVPELAPFARRLELDLGLRGDEVFFEAFVSKGAGSAVHFDPNVTINIQLIGSKQWQMAENTHLRHPHAGWSVGMELDDEMKAYARQPLPSKMPRGSRSFEARQGTLVYLHPGYWHSTVNHEPSLSLLYTVEPPSWADLLGDEITAHLNTVDDARELAFGLGSTGGQDRKQQRLRKLIQEVRNAADRMSSDGLLAKWGASHTAAFEREASVKYHAQVVEKDGERKVVLTTKVGRTTRRTELPVDGTAALRYIARKRRFYGHEVASAVERASAEGIGEILEGLEKSGLIIRTSAA
jgi:50S ribosomal protein L16 3-hydroxylase